MTFKNTNVPKNIFGRIHKRFWALIFLLILCLKFDRLDTLITSKEGFLNHTY